jgi:hypothetical protein
MRYVVLLALAITIAFAGEWIYRSFLRPIDQPTEEMLALERHMKKKGVKVSLYPVRHGFSHSSVVAHGAFRIENFPLPVSVSQSPSEAAAESHLQSIQRGPNLMFPARNGRLVIFFPMWGEDTAAFAKQFTTEFKAFKE